eukprot:4821143-Prorocentrum_lima.AAC.1
MMCGAKASGCWWEMRMRGGRQCVCTEGAGNDGCAHGNGAMHCVRSRRTTRCGCPTTEMPPVAH